MNHPAWPLTLGLLLASITSYSKPVLPAVFSDHLVLQRNARVAIWGWSDPGDTVALTGSWVPAETVKTLTSRDGRWKTWISTGQAGGPYTLTVKGKYGSVALQDVLLGEVWICSGQSNMDFNAGWGLKNKDSVIAAASFPDIRFFQVHKAGADYPQDDTKGAWAACTPQTMATFSSIGYFFGRELHETLHVPIGLIQAAWGGTPAEVWVRKDRVDANPELVAHEYDDHSAGWPAAPGVLYNGMMAPVIPYGIAGAIWYQGESNTHSPDTYAVLMDSLINGWREDFGREFPFYFVQIAPFAYDTATRSYILREQQALAARTIPSAGMVVIGDVAGDVHDIHPKDKKTVGMRLAWMALAETYGDSVAPYQSPSYRSMSVKGRRVTLGFDHAEGGLKSSGPEIAGFEVAGSDRRFVPAKAKIEGSTVVVEAAGVDNPEAVRYCFSNSAVPTVSGEQGNLPLAPFRTDSWPMTGQ